MTLSFVNLIRIVHVI